ncbi:glutamine amidotransferase family protein [soil metagenome]
MCGIVGLHLRNPAMEPELGILTTRMLEAMTERGPDSAGIALYEANGSETKVTVRSPSEHYDWDRFAEQLSEHLSTPVGLRPAGPGAVVTVAVSGEEASSGIAAVDPGVRVMSRGRAVELFKDVGTPRDICDRYGIPSRGGYQSVGHTRLATESAVTTEHSHPFSPDDDICLVHNGSFSNYFTIRRDLEDQGVEFVTDNDSEVAARWIALEMERGADLGAALRSMMGAMDGFYTLLVSTRDQFAVVRDAFACKPAVIAETDDYVAMASEYRALAELPGVEDAEVFEPMPEDIHLWSR